MIYLHIKSVHMPFHPRWPRHLSELHVSATPQVADHDSRAGGGKGQELQWGDSCTLSGGDWRSKIQKFTKENGAMIPRLISRFEL